jgi:DNA-binding transcriptional regulator of glucitol operon
MEFLGSVITIAVGLWVGQMLIDWWKSNGRY